jgi:hypothetical protein
MDGSDAALEGIAPVVGLDLTGTWHLADCILTYASGKEQRPWASSASGYLIYAPNGHMCKSLNYPSRDGSIGCISYCGEYQIVGDRVRHAISVSADIRDVGTVLEQTVHLEHGRLTLSVSPAPAGGPGSVIEYVWNRAEAAQHDNLSTPRAQNGNSFKNGR